MIKRWQCSHDGCELSFAKKSHLTRHKLTHTGQRPYACSICDKTFARREHVLRHERGHSAETPFVCDVGDCSKGFADKGYLKRHLKVHNKPFVCEECGMMFSKSSHLQLHIIKHKAIFDGYKFDQPLNCPSNDCKSLLFSRADFLKHWRRHKRAVRYDCKECEGYFFKLAELRAHEKLHHPKQILCHLCGKQFSRVGRLKSHLQTQHLANNVPSRSVHYACRIFDCGISFTTRNGLRVHQRVKHYGIGTFSCKDCGKSFTTKWSLVRHCHSEHGSSDLVGASAGGDEENGDGVKEAKAIETDGEAKEEEGKVAEEDKKTCVAAL